MRVGKTVCCGGGAQLVPSAVARADTDQGDCQETVVREKVRVELEYSPGAQGARNRGKDDEPISIAPYRLSLIQRFRGRT